MDNITPSSSAFWWSLGGWSQKHERLLRRVIGQQVLSTEELLTVLIKLKLSSIRGVLPCCKYLGVYIDPTLTFRDHIDNVVKKLNRFCGLIHHVSYLYPKKCLLFYNAYAKIDHNIWLFNLRSRGQN